MRRRGHLRLLGLATLVWTGFLLAGLPEYYQQYSTRFMVGFDFLVLVLVAIVLLIVVVRLPPARRMRTGLWIAFYFTVPLAVYDYVYCGLVLDRGLKFLWEFWYLTVYYLIPWPLVLGVVWLANQRAWRIPRRGAA